MLKANTSETSEADRTVTVQANKATGFHGVTVRVPVKVDRGVVCYIVAKIKAAFESLYRVATRGKDSTWSFLKVFGIVSCGDMFLDRF